MHHLGKNIKFLRKKRGESQTELAKQVSKGHTTIGNWEKGDSEPNLSELLVLAKYLEISVDDLLKKDLESDDPSDNTEKLSLGIPKPFSDPILLNLAQEVKRLRRDVNKLMRE